MGAPRSYHSAQDEILRQASVALGGRPVVLYQAARPESLECRAATDPSELDRPVDLDLYSTLERWGVPIRQGSRWIATRAWDVGPWVLAPVRTRLPDPPPGGKERRSRERMTLELAGLCLGLGERRAGDGGEAAPPDVGDVFTQPAIIAHQAGNPIAAARAGLQLAIENVGRWAEVAPARRADLLEELGRVTEDLDRAAEFLRAVQDRARGALPRVERFDAMRVVRSCLNLERGLLQQRGVAVELSGASESVYLRGDPNDLYDLLVNLVRNAADASERSRTPVLVQVDRAGDQLALTVRDSGAGIATEDLPRVFEPGFTTKEFGVGSGMGLAIVRRAAEERFGGRVLVDSQPGRGSAFTVLLPVPPQRGGDAATAVPEAAARQPSAPHTS